MLQLMFFKTLKWNLCIFTIFIIKPEVAEMMTMTHQLSSSDPTEKSYISHSHVSVSSSEDAIKQHGDLH